MTHFVYPEMFWLLLLPFAIRLLLPAAKGLHGDALRVPFLNDIEKINIKSGWLWKNSGSGMPQNRPELILLYVVWALLVTAAARPQWAGEPVRLPGMSRDILMVVDISTSMREPDFAINNRRVERLTAVKKTASEFIKNRADDRIGLVLFGTRAYLQAPITFDKKSVEDILWSTDAGMAGNSTAIGDALGLALKSLRDNPHKDQKVIILLTDGENNDGSLSLPQAISLAKQEGVKIYTIGVGSDNSLMNSIFGIVIRGSGGPDEESLSQIAEETKGTYFRAQDTQSLERIYQEINKLEAQENEAQFIREVKELFFWPLGIALILASGLMFMARRK